MHNLSLHVDAGIDLSRALQFCSKGVPRTMRRSIMKIVEAIDEGRPIAESMEMHVPDMLPRSFYRVIEIGEKSGCLSHALKIVDEQLSELMLRRRGAVSALTYPSMIILVSGSIMLFLLLRVVPTLGEIFADMGAPLPSRTQALMVLSGFIHSNILIICLLLAGTLFGLYSFVHLARRIGAMGEIFIRIPYFGTIVYHEQNMLFSMLMSMLLNVGTSTHEALLLCESEAMWAFYRQGIVKVRKEVSDGKTLAEAIGGQKVFSPTFRWLVSAGDYNGDMVTVLDAIGEYETEYVKNKVLMIQNIFEPTLILCYSLVVGVMGALMWLPLLSIADLI
jgi:type IV pilus assembly protein PilC